MLGAIRSNKLLIVAGMSERMSDYITGHAHKSAGAGYGAPTLDDMAEAMKKFPRYAV